MICAILEPQVPTAANVTRTLARCLFYNVYLKAATFVFARLSVTLTISASALVVANLIKERDRLNDTHHEIPLIPAANMAIDRLPNMPSNLWNI